MRMKQFLMAASALAAVGLMAETAGAAPLSSVLGPGINLLSDNSAESLINGPGSTGATTVDVGDRLRGTFSIGTVERGGPAISIGGTSGVNELTGIFDITVVEKVALGGAFSTGGICPNIVCFTFGPTASFAAEMASAGFSNTTGAMAAFFEDSANNYDRQLGTVAAVEATATDGTPFWLVGFDDPNDFWFAGANTDDISVASILAALTNFGNVNAGLSILDAVGGPLVREGAIACSNLAKPLLSSTNPADICGQGSLLAKGAPGSTGEITTPYDSLDDVNFQVSLVPEPASLALFGAGLAAFGFASRRRRKA